MQAVLAGFPYLNRGGIPSVVVNLYVYGVHTAGLEAKYSYNDVWSVPAPPDPL